MAGVQHPVMHVHVHHACGVYNGQAGVQLNSQKRNNPLALLEPAGTAASSVPTPTGVKATGVPAKFWPGSESSASRRGSSSRPTCERLGTLSAG